MEGLLTELKDYKPDEKRAKKFMEELSSYCKENKIKLCLVSGYHEDIAKKKFGESFLTEYFDENCFHYVDEEYLKNKADADEALHREHLEKDPEFNDSYFKQVAMQKHMEEDGVSTDEVLLLSDDIWVDGFYTIKFSKVDFAIFEENITERGNPTKRIPGLAYFNLDFDSVKVLVEDFPEVDTSKLEKFVVDSMAKILMEGADLSGVVEKRREQLGNKIKGEKEGQ